MATLHTIKIDASRFFHVDAQDDQVVLSVQNFLINTSSIQLDPQTAKALGAALYLTAESVSKAVI